MKLGAMKAQLPWALEEADLAFCLQGDYGWSARRGAGAAGRAGAWWPTRSTRWWPPVVQAARPGDHVLCMSNGGFGGIHGKLLDALQARPDDAPRARRHLLYLHGFRSSPQSFKAQRLQAWLAAHRPDVHWWCPQLPPSPRAAMALVRDGIAGWPARPLGRARQLARRLLRHGGGRGHRLAGGAAEPGRRPGARPGRAMSAS